MTPQFKLYRIQFPVLSWLLLRFMLRVRLTGLENIPKDGAFIVTAEHTSNFDPFIMMYVFGKEHHIHILTKAEAFRAPLIGSVLRGVGMICVDRSTNDISAVRQSLEYLKRGEKLGIFPEGRRIREGEAADAKLGAVRFASATGAPILPLYIPKKKRLFRRTPIVIGEPYFVNPERRRLTAEEYRPLAAEVMERIRSLKP
ncbi:MAG: 1-acyl-sn-glycerol-3-phosphate acyltransferase [Oscillospiraceae bacterium]|jgi:1-acyl-sn-glycerol-3-phosphate acyltransferase|nr:1-acyl-sn-glycerol-3-phosphate acyltransferase [Oscillospiraceae bacterium]